MYREVRDEQAPKSGIICGKHRNLPDAARGFKKKLGSKRVRTHNFSSLKKLSKGKFVIKPEMIYAALKFMRFKRERQKRQEDS